MASTSASRAARPGLAPAPQAAWSVSAPNPLVSAGSPRLPETLLALGLAVETQLVPGLGFPNAELAMILLLALAAFRTPRRDLTRFALLGLVAAGLLAYLVAVTLHNDLDPTRPGASPASPSWRCSSTRSPANGWTSRASSTAWRRAA